MNHSYMGPQTEWRKRAGAVIGARAATGQKYIFFKKINGQLYSPFVYQIQ